LAFIRVYSHPFVVKNSRGLGLIVLGLWLAVILGVMIRGIAAPHQNSVFTVFRDAGRAWLGAQPLYSQVGKYLYSPLAAAFFAPFASIPHWAGSALWRLTNGVAYFVAVSRWFSGRGELPLVRGTGDKAKGNPDEGELMLTVLGLLLLLPLSIGNLNNAQASPLIIALLLFGCLAFLNERWTLAAGCIAFAAFFKIYPLAIGLLLAVIEPRRMGWRLVLAVLIFGALSLVLQRPAYVIDQYRDWWLCLGGDQRRVSTELGFWRDAWLLLRILHVPITVPGYAVLQAGTAIAAAIFCWWRSKSWDRAAVVWSALSIGCLWITLFGPSTELATYVFIAPAVAFACSRVLLPAIQGRSRLDWFQFLPITAYAMLLLAEALNSWVTVIRLNTYLHAIQPLAALLFLGFVVGWKPVPYQPVPVRAPS
jgi:Glycosyltransferase family 87